MVSLQQLDSSTSRQNFSDIEDCVNDIMAQELIDDVCPRMDHADCLSVLLLPLISYGSVRE